MKVLRRVMGGAAKGIVVVAALAAVVLVLARDSEESVDATSVEIVTSHSDTSPNTLSAAVIMNNGTIGGPSPCAPGENDPTTACLWVWAKKVGVGPNSASAFEVNFTFNATLIHVHTFLDFTTWLASTGRSITCNDQELFQNPTTGEGWGTASCNSLLPPPPYGATGNGILAQIAVESRSPALGSTILNLTGSALVNTPADPNNQAAIPLVVRSVNIVVAKCADFSPPPNGDDTIRVNDILYVVGKYFTPDGDLNGDLMTRVDDILIAVQQYFVNCSQ